jgi:hypothetical protein
MRHNFFNSLPSGHTCSFTLCAFYFLDKSNQTKKVFDSEMCASRRDGNEWILWPDVRPLQRHGRFASLGIQKEDTTLARQLPYAVNLKLDISVWMKRVNDLECLIAKILLGCS